MLSILVVLSLLVAYLIKRQLSFWTRQGVPNEVGLFFEAVRIGFHKVDIAAAKRNGKLTGTYNFLSPALLVTDAELAKQVLGTNFNDFAGHMKLCHSSDFMGESLLTVNDVDRWRELRNIISPVFTPAKLRSMQPLIEESCEDLAELFTSKVGEAVDMKKVFAAYTLDVIASTAFGTKVNTLKDPNSLIAIQSRSFLTSDISLTGLLILAMPWFAIDVLGLHFLPRAPSKFFCDLTADIVKRRRQDPSLRRNDFIQFLMEAEHDGQRLTVKEIADNGLLFFLAGHDTTAVTLVHVSYYLAMNESVQDRLVAEVDSLQETTYEAICDLKYLEAVINETLRISSTVVRSMRAASSDCTLGDAFVPKGTMVMVANYAVLMDPENFERPEEFLPERFLSSSKLRHKHQAFVAFAPGQRNCIGQNFAMFEMKRVLVHILKRFKFAKCKETKVPLEYFHSIPLLQPKEVLLDVTPRL